MEQEIKLPRTENVTITIEVHDPESVQVHLIELDPREAAAIVPLIRLLLASRHQTEKNTR